MIFTDTGARRPSDDEMTEITNDPIAVYMTAVWMNAEGLIPDPDVEIVIVDIDQGGDD